MQQAFSLTSQVVVLDRQLQAHPLKTGPELYAQLDQQFAGFAGCYLVSEYSFNASWPGFEMHPAGDELLYLLAGSCELLLELPDGPQRVRFDQPGQVQLIPKGCWHRAELAGGGQCRILFVTPGEGTLHRPA